MAAIGAAMATYKGHLPILIKHQLINELRPHGTFSNRKFAP